MRKYHLLGDVNCISQTITKYGKCNFNLDCCSGRKFLLEEIMYLCILLLLDQDICHFDTSIFNLSENLHLMGGPSSQEVKMYLRCFKIKEAKM